MSEHSVDRKTLAGDPFPFVAAELEAIAEEEARLGRPMTPGERDAFVRGFHAVSYAAEIRLLAAEGLLSEADEDDG